MAHHSRLLKVVIDVPDADHDEAVAFWEGAAGVALSASQRYPEYRGAELSGTGFGLLTQRLGEGQARVHLDIHTDDLDAEVARLEHLGARRVREVNGWWIMQDPAGLPFCVIPDSSEEFANSDPTRWD